MTDYRPPHPVFSKNIIEMLTVANEYCLFVESIEKYNYADILSYMLKLAPLLYLKGAMLPQIEVSDEWANERFVTEEQYINIYNTILNKLDNKNLYKDADNISMYDTELIEYNFAEVLADVYQDLKDFVLLYQKETLAAKENAVFNCKLSFQNNWGKKMVSAMKYLHFKISNETQSDL